MPILTGPTGPRQTRPIGPVTPNLRSPQANGLVVWVPFNGPGFSVVSDVITGTRTTGAGGTSFTPTMGPYGVEADTQSSIAQLYPGVTRVLSAITVAYWFRPTWNASDNIVGRTAAFGPNTSFPTEAYYNSDGATYYRFYFYDNATGASNYFDVGASGFAAGDLLHVVHTYFGDGVTSGISYFNGVEQSTVTSAVAHSRNVQLLVLGSDITGAFTSQQTLLDFRIYDRALSRQEAFQLYDAGTRWELYDPAPRLWIPGVTVASAASQSLTLPTVSSGGTTYAPTLSVGAVALTGATLATGAATYAPTLKYAVSLPTVASGATLAAPTLAHVAALPTVASGASLEAPTLSVGAVTLLPGTIAAGSALTAPSLSVGAVTLTGATISAGAALTAPTLAAAVSLPTIASGASVAAPRLAQAVSLPTVASGASVAAPSAAQTLSLATLATGASLAAPTLAVGAVTLTAPTIASGASLFTLSLSNGGLAGATIASGATLAAPTLTLTLSLPLLEPQEGEESRTYTPRVGYQVAVPLLEPAEGEESRPYAPRVAYGATTPTVASGATLAAPTVALGSSDQAVTGAFLTATGVLFAPRIVGGQIDYGEWLFDTVGDATTPSTRLGDASAAGSLSSDLDDEDSPQQASLSTRLGDVG